MNLQGKKTYGIALLMLLHSAASYFLGQNQSLDLKEVFEALGLAALRAGVAKGASPAMILALLLPAFLIGSAHAASSPSSHEMPALSATDPGGKDLSVGQATGRLPSILLLAALADGPATPTVTPGPSSPATAAKALAPEERRLFRAGEIGLDGFGSARSSDLKDYRTGGGVGISYFPMRGAGLRGELLTENAQHSGIDAAGLTLLGRLASDKLHAALEYGVGFNAHFDANPWLKKDTFTIHAEIGPRFRLTQNWDIWGKIRGVRPALTSQGEHLQFLIGTGVNFGGK